MKLQCATIHADTSIFTVVIAPSQVVSDEQRAAEAIAFFEAQCFRMPTVLVACDEARCPKAFFGRNDLAVLLAPIPPAAIPWKDVDVSAAAG